eukprot:c24565_g1_i1 orf=53-1726(+)
MMGEVGEISDSSPLTSGMKLRRIRVKPVAGNRTFEDITDGELKSEAEPMTPAGQIFSDRSFNCHIVILFGFKHPIDLEALRSQLQDSLLKHKRFCSIVKKDKEGNLYWTQTSVNFDDHLIIPEIPDDQMHSGTFVEDYVANLAGSRPLDPLRPLWEVHVLNARLGEAAANAVFRLHHALGDGISLMSLFLACTRQVDKPELLPTIPSQTRRTVGIVQYEGMHNTERKIIVSSIVHLWKLLLLIWRLLLVFWYTCVDICIIISTCLWMDDSETPIKGFRGVELEPKVLAHATFKLENLLMVKRATNGTVNDVLLGLLSAALTRYLQYHFVEDAEKEKKKFEEETKNAKTINEEYTSKIGKGPKTRHLKSTTHLRVRASALVNSRPSPGLQDFSAMMDNGSQARWGNQISYLILPLAIGEYKDPLEYVHRAKAIIDRKKKSLALLYSYKGGVLLMNLIGAKAAAWIACRCVSHATLSFSNVAGPLEPVQFANNPITHMIPTVYGQPQSLCVHFQSYKGEVTMVVSGARNLVPDPKRLCDFMLSSLQEMNKAVRSAPINN